MTRSAAPPEGESQTLGVWQRPDDRFIPLRPIDLACDLAVDGQLGLVREDFVAVAHALESALDVETAALQRAIGDDYVSFNPDRDTLPRSGEIAPSAAECIKLCEDLSRLLDKSNYEKLSAVQIEQAVLSASRQHLYVKVDPSRVKFLEVWIRGRGRTLRRERNQWWPWRFDEREVDIFRRMVVVAQLTDDPHILLKQFKDIPEYEVKALLPHAEVTMSLLDRLKLMAASVGTVGMTASKLLKVAIGFAALGKLVWILLIGAITLAIRAVLGYRNARVNRDFKRTNRLYFQNMGNNSSVLQMLVASVKLEELKESLLAYAFCVAPTRQWQSEVELQAAIERWLKDKYGIAVDFDLPDALATLERLRLWNDRPKLAVLTSAAAVSMLASHRSTAAVL